MSTLYMVKFINSGIKAFTHHGKILGLCTLNSVLCKTESEAINNMLCILYSEGGIFSNEYIEYKNSDLKDYVMNECKGRVELLNKCYPNKDCGTIFSFELITVNVTDIKCDMDPLSYVTNMKFSIGLN